MKPPKQTYTLTLQALNDDSRPPIVRMRQILKLCLRGFRMRCTAIEDSTPTDEADVSASQQEMLMGPPRLPM